MMAVGRRMRLSSSPSDAGLRAGGSGYIRRAVGGGASASRLRFATISSVALPASCTHRSLRWKARDRGTQGTGNGALVSD